MKNTPLPDSIYARYKDSDQSLFETRKSASARATSVRASDLKEGHVIKLMGKSHKVKSNASTGVPGMTTVITSRGDRLVLQRNQLVFLG